MRVWSWLVYLTRKINLYPYYIVYRDSLFNFYSLQRRLCTCSWHCLLHLWRWKLVSEDLLKVKLLTTIHSFHVMIIWALPCHYDKKVSFQHSDLSQNSNAWHSARMQSPALTKGFPLLAKRANAPPRMEGRGC